jgi:selenocysteine lyase/cysteine desulfurase
MIPVNFDAIGCDSYAFSGHKWLGGPHETGVLYIRRSGLRPWPRPASEPIRPSSIT